MKIAFIGVGNMGAAIVPRLLAAGHEVFAWNRTAAAVERLKGVERLGRAADAFQHEVVITMLADDAAVREVVVDSGALASARRGGVHVVMSTISVALVEELSQAHRAAGVRYVAAPVFGVPAVAAEGGLNILAAGPADAIDTLQPVFEAIGRKTWRLGSDPRHAMVAKVAGNLMITQAIQSMAEATALTERYGLAAGAFLEVVTQTMFASPSYQRYGRNIATGTYEPGFKLSLGLKDVNLALEAAGSARLSLPVAAIVRAALMQSVQAGDGAKDWSALAKVARGESGQATASPDRSVVMVVSYQAEAGARFDRDYYLSHHIPLVERAWRPFGLESVDVLFGATTTQATVAVCLCGFRDEAAMRAAAEAPATAGVMADVKVFTDITPERSFLNRNA